MTVEELLIAALKASPDLVAVKAYPEAAPDGPAAPFIIYTQYAGSRVNSLTGDSGLANPRFQVDVFAKTKAQAVALKNAVRVALLADAALGAVFVSEGSTYEPDPKLYRQRQDFSFWIQE